MIRTILEYACLAVGLAGCLALGWSFRGIRDDRQAETAARAAPSGPQVPDVDGAPPFTYPAPDDDDDEATAAWLASLHNGFMDAYRADQQVVREWIELGCIGPLPQADSWEWDELVLRGLIISQAELLVLEAEADRFGAEDDRGPLLELAAAQ
jgi:hypothetical protein